MVIIMGAGGKKVIVGGAANAATDTQPEMLRANPTRDHLGSYPQGPL
jgi:hypothetical protein